MSATLSRILFNYSDFALGQPEQVEQLRGFCEQCKTKCIDVWIIVDGSPEDAERELNRSDLTKFCEGVVSLTHPDQMGSVGAFLSDKLREGWIPREQITVTFDPFMMKSIFIDEKGVKRRLVLSHTLRFAASDVKGYTSHDFEILLGRVMKYYTATSHYYYRNGSQDALVDEWDNPAKASIDAMEPEERHTALVQIKQRTRQAVGEYVRGRPDFAKIAGVPEWSANEDRVQTENKTAKAKRATLGTETTPNSPRSSGKINVKHFGTRKAESPPPPLKKTHTLTYVEEGMEVIIGAGAMAGRKGKVIRVAGVGSEKRYRVEADGQTTWTNKVRALETEEEPPAAETPATRHGFANAKAPPPSKMAEPPEPFPPGTIVEITDGSNKGKCGTVRKILVENKLKKYRVEIEADEGASWVVGVKKASRPLRQKEVVKSPQDDWNIERKNLGSGAFGSVKKVTHKKAPGLVRAMKVIRKQLVKKLDMIWKEVDFMKRLDHPNIIKCYSTYEDARSVYLIMELCTGGELFDQIIDAGHFTERQAAHVMEQVLRGVYYMHSKRICHRDLKPENFLLTSRIPLDKVGIKIIDFGISSNFPAEGEELKSYVGSVYYVAPEVLKSRYNELADLWSFGVITYVVLCGNPPFGGDDDAEIEKKVEKGKYVYDDLWDDISPDAKNFVDKLLDMDWKKKRIDAATAMEHPWINRMAPRASPKRLGSTVQRLKEFHAQSKFKRLALQVVANQMNESQISHLREAFAILDTNGDGFLSLEELHNGMERVGSGNKDEIQVLMGLIDANNSGKIDYTEFLSAAIDRKIYSQEDMCWAAFKVFDRNGDGKISKDEVQAVLQSSEIQMPPGDIEKMMQEVDKNADAEIDFDEFMAMMRLG